MFFREPSYNLRCRSVVKLPGTNTIKYGINELNCRGAALRNIITKIYWFPRRYENLRSLKLPEFKSLKKHLIPSDGAAYSF